MKTGKGGYVYIMTNTYRTVFYIGVTSNLALRSFQHKNLEGSKFTTRYQCTDLVYYEFHDFIEEAILREKQMKKWNREWKSNLVRSYNPEMRDLYDEVRHLD